MRRNPNPEMILLARESRGYTQSALAKASGVSNGLISKVEHEIVRANDDLVRAMAKELRYPSSLFYRPEHVRGTDSPCFHHRKRKTISARMLDRIEAQMHLAQLQVKRMLADLEIESTREFASMDPDEYGGPPQVAQALRSLWRLPSGPIPHLVNVAETAGAVVVRRDFGTEKLDGMSSWARDCPPLFFINSRIPTDRMRWTLAHELGHLVMHPHMASGDQEEEADHFAQEFLAPEAELLHDLRKLSFVRLPPLKMHWRISMIALVRAASRLDALPQNKIKSLYVQISRSGWRKDEPYPLSDEAPTVLRDAIAVHIKEHGYSKEDLALAVDLLPDEFEELYSLPDDRRLRAV